MILIVDYGMGNVQSVANAFEQLGEKVTISNLPADLDRADRIVLPGVGAFGEGMSQLQSLNLIDALTEQVVMKKKPFLGICLGMQLLADEGYEFGHHRGLGWIKGSVRRLEPGNLVLPHVGWNNINAQRPSPLTDRLPSGIDFYFVHSFHFDTAQPEKVVATCEYGNPFTAIINQENIYGAQFHPEKSQKAGKILLENFIRLS